MFFNLEWSIWNKKNGVDGYGLAGHDKNALFKCHDNENNLTSMFGNKRIYGTITTNVSGKRCVLDWSKQRKGPE